MRVDGGVGVQGHLNNDAVNVGIVVQPVDLTEQLDLSRAPERKTRSKKGLAGHGGTGGIMARISQPNKRFTPCA